MSALPAPVDVPALLSWFTRVKRDLPWRERVSPYRTLVSELMLQQTRVETVIPYFNRFMQDFPTVEALASAPIERVLERWAGLGYYSRARNLHAAARKVVEQGGFPTTIAGLRELPGVGPYTAGAVGSLALGLDAPLVDGNVERVFCRLFAWDQEPAKIKAQLWEAAEALLPAGQAGAFNEALMELGATVCTPTSPSCLICPLRDQCLGQGAPERYPKRAEKKKSPEIRAVCLVTAPMLLLGKRAEGGLLGGLWEPVLIEAGSPDQLTSHPASLQSCGSILHIFSHRRLTVAVYTGPLPDPIPEVFVQHYHALKVVSSEDARTMALSGLAVKLLAQPQADARPARKSRRPKNLAPETPS